MKFNTIFITSILAITAISFSSQAHIRSNPSTVKTIQQLTIHITGTVTGWKDSKGNMCNGFYVQTSEKKFLVKFKPNLSAKLKEAVNINSLVTVTGKLNLSCRNQDEISFESMSVNGVRITDENTKRHGKVSMTSL